MVFPEFSLFTDHKNILYMLAPSLFQTNVAGHIVHKVQHWALRLSEFKFTVEHIPGEDNVWADMLTRWAAPSNATFPVRRITALRAPYITSTADTPDLPSLAVISESQNRTSPPANSAYTLTYDSVPVWKNAQGKLYVPPDD